MTRVEWGVIVSIAMSAGTALFTGGIVYGQVQAQQVRQDKLEARMDGRDDKLAGMAADIASMKAQVDYLAQAQRERGERAGR